MENSKKYKTTTDAEQGKNLIVAEPVVEYYAEKKKSSYVSRGVTFTIDPNLKASDIEPEKTIRARKMFENYRKTH